MNKTFIIALKELKAFFRSPTAYIILIITVSVFNIFFFFIIEENREATLCDVFQVMGFLFVFIVPLLTMRAFAEEKQNGTMEFLMTTPTSNLAICLGKYFGSLMFFTLIVLLTGVYYVIIEFYGRPDRVAVLTGYVGVWLEGALFIAIGMMTSSWTRHVLVAAMSSYVILFFIYFSGSFAKYASGTLEIFLKYVSTLSRAEHFAVGLITLSDIVYYGAGIVFCLAITRLCIENRLSR